MCQHQPDQPLRTSAEYRVVADDRTLLYARVDGKPDAAVTVVLCHGWGLSSTSWCFQRVALSDRARVVSWDQRGHGRSEYGQPGNGSIRQLGRDLYEVLDQLVPDGPIVLVGHSMGGMTIMALAEEHPELFGDRVIAVALLATTARPISPSLGLPTGGSTLYLAAQWAVQRITPEVLPVLRLVRRLPGYQRTFREIIRRFAFASVVSTTVMDLLIGMLETTPLQVATEMFTELAWHDRRVALRALQRVTTLVMVGQKDVLTPPADAKAIAAEVPGADLVIVPDCGHALILERPEVINEWLCALLGPQRLDEAS